MTNTSKIAGLLLAASLVAATATVTVPAALAQTAAPMIAAGQKVVDPEDRQLGTVERIISADNPDWRPARLTSSDDQDDYGLEQVERLLKERVRK